MALLQIQNGLVITDPLAGEHVSKDLFFEDGVIVDNPGGVEKAESVIDASGCFVLPGLIDAHTHLYGALASGMPLKDAPPHTFPQILERIWWRLDKVLTTEDVEISGLVGGIASLRAGITTIFDHHASPSCASGSLTILSGAVDRIGLRASFAYEVSERNGAGSRDEGIEENQRFLHACKIANDPLRRAHFGIHAVFSVSGETILRCSTLGQELDAGFHLHVLEHRTEREKFEAEHQGQSVVAFLAEAGILGPKTIAAHTVHLTSEDIVCLAETGTWTVHNPKSNMGNGVGVSPVRELLRMSGKTCLGTDGFYDLPQQMIATPLLQTLHAGDPAAFNSGDVIEMVYGNNAALAQSSFNMPFGKLKPGYVADILVIPYDPPTPVISENLAGHIVSALAAGPREVIIAGALRFHGGQLPHIDEAEIYARSRRLATSLWQRM